MDSRLRGSDGVVAGAQPMPPCRSRAPLSFPRPLVVPPEPFCVRRGVLSAKAGIQSLSFSMYHWASNYQLTPYRPLDMSRWSCIIQLLIPQRLQGLGFFLCSTEGEPYNGKKVLGI
jgi:hypothetical protein